MEAEQDDLMSPGASWQDVQGVEAQENHSHWPESVGQAAISSRESVLGQVLPSVPAVARIVRFLCLSGNRCWWCGVGQSGAGHEDQGDQGDTMQS